MSLFLRFRVNVKVKLTLTFWPKWVLTNCGRLSSVPVLSLVQIHAMSAKYSNNCAQNKAPFDKLDMTQGQGQLPRITGRTGWNQCSFGEECILFYVQIWRLLLSWGLAENNAKRKTQNAKQIWSTLLFWDTYTMNYLPISQELYHQSKFSQ